MRPLVIDVARTVVCVYVCLCIGHAGLLTCAKMAEPIELPFGGGADSYWSKQPRSGKSIRICEILQVGDAAFCHIVLDNCYYCYY